jgi:hypothetical protein
MAEHYAKVGTKGQLRARMLAEAERERDELPSEPNQMYLEVEHQEGYPPYWLHKYGLDAIQPFLELIRRKENIVSARRSEGTIESLQEDCRQFLLRVLNRHHTDIQINNFIEELRENGLIHLEHNQTTQKSKSKSGVTTGS